MRCFVYRNLHKPDYVYSLRAVEGMWRGRVLGYSKNLILSDVIFKVYEAGRKRALATNQRNVHAGIIGTIISAPDFVQRIAVNLPSREINCDNEQQYITYNPWFGSTFYYKLTGEPIVSSPLIIISGRLISPGTTE